MHLKIKNAKLDTLQIRALPREFRFPLKIIK
jgi:hypothetical protein